MRLDKNFYIGVKASGPMSKLDVSSDFYLGGVPLLSSSQKAALKDVKSQHDFTGCVDSLKVFFMFFQYLLHHHMEH